MTKLKILKISGWTVIAYTIFALGAVVITAMIGFILDDKEFFVARNQTCFALIGIMMCLWALYLLLALTLAIIPGKVISMFEIFSGLVPGHITSSDNSRPSFKVSESTVKAYCDLAVNALTQSQLSQLDENPIKAEQYLQDGINYIKKLRSML